ncbi:hypothetical protein Dsin_022627 [Dipteronia sinensis]|uniref:Aminotransferase-like plant mobile domain-containing protein n=1 Tax=Dipteronia sinensis TaxID=43782 RepID=A0AAE0E1B4_9ROSI|nr:hypothetical protein Dsin_022627 [Dipteronia sinensis]
MSASVNAHLPEEFGSFALCLRTSQLVGLDCVEHYLPHRVAMQFGMDQDLPACVARANDTPDHVAWTLYCKPITCAKLYIPPRLYEAGMTARYSNWWKESILRLKVESEAVRPIKRAFSRRNSTPRRSKAAKGSQSEGNKYATELPEFELRDPVSLLEKISAELEAAAFMSSFYSMEDHNGIDYPRKYMDGSFQVNKLARSPKYDTLMSLSAIGRIVPENPFSPRSCDNKWVKSCKDADSSPDRLLLLSFYPKSKGSEHIELGMPRG